MTPLNPPPPPLHPHPPLIPSERARRRDAVPLVRRGGRGPRRARRAPPHGPGERPGMNGGLGKTVRFPESGTGGVCRDGVQNSLYPGQSSMESQAEEASSHDAPHVRICCFSAQLDRGWSVTPRHGPRCWEKPCALLAVAPPPANPPRPVLNRRANVQRSEPLSKKPRSRPPLNHITRLGSLLSSARRRADHRDHRRHGLTGPLRGTKHIVCQVLKPPRRPHRAPKGNPRSSSKANVLSAANGETNETLVYEIQLKRKPGLIPVLAPGHSRVALSRTAGCVEIHAAPKSRIQNSSIKRKQQQQQQSSLQWS